MRQLRFVFALALLAVIGGRVLAGPDGPKPAPAPSLKVGELKVPEHDEGGEPYAFDIAEHAGGLLVAASYYDRGRLWWFKDEELKPVMSAGKQVAGSILFIEEDGDVALVSSTEDDTVEASYVIRDGKAALCVNPDKTPFSRGDYYAQCVGDRLMVSVGVDRLDGEHYVVEDNTAHRLLLPDGEPLKVDPTSHLGFDGAVYCVVSNSDSTLYTDYILGAKGQLLAVDDPPVPQKLKGRKLAFDICAFEDYSVVVATDLGDDAGFVWLVRDGKVEELKSDAGVAVKHDYLGTWRTRQYLYLFGYDDEPRLDDFEGSVYRLDEGVAVNLPLPESRRAGIPMPVSLTEPLLVSVENAQGADELWMAGAEKMELLKTSKGRPARVDYDGVSHRTENYTLVSHKSTGQHTLAVVDGNVVRTLPSKIDFSTPVHVGDWVYEIGGELLYVQTAIKIDGNFLQLRRAVREKETYTFKLVEFPKGQNLESEELSTAKVDDRLFVSIGSYGENPRLLVISK